MAASFSWSDTFHIAFTSCLPCFSSSKAGLASNSEESINNHLNDPTFNRVRRARPDELQGLLADAIESTDTEAERMSLHSNPNGRRHRRRRTKKKPKKSITLFGFDLFGKPRPPPIHLPESDDEGPAGSSSPSPGPLTRSSSGSLTFDADVDAAPLDPETIADISGSSAQLTQRALEIQAEAEARRLKEERRAKRRERRELRRVARLMAAEGGDEFEGFQGSGESSYPRIPSPMYRQRGDTAEGYGPFVPAPRDAAQDEESGEPADLDGSFYARSARPDENGSRSGSDSRSRTSGSRSSYTHHSAYAAQPGARILNPGIPVGDSKDKVQNHSTTKPKSKSSKTSRSSASASSKQPRSTGSSATTTSQSTSLASPATPSFPSPMTSDIPSSPTPYRDGFPSVGLGAESKFPSQGFGRRGNMNAHALGGAFLATRGGPDDDAQANAASGF